MLAGMCRYEAIAENQIVFEEGDKGDKLYILLSGQCSVNVKRASDDSGQLLPSKRMFSTANGELFGRDSKGREPSPSKRFSLDMSQVQDTQIKNLSELAEAQVATPEDGQETSVQVRK